MTMAPPHSTARRLLHRLPALLDVALLRRTDPGAFEPVAPLPDWVPDLWPQGNTEAVDIAASYFLADFVEHAAPHWSSDMATPLWSDPWSESDTQGHTHVLEAAVLTLEGEPLLMIRPAQSPPEHTQRVLQESRMQALEMRDLMREVNKREVLLHCIIHDLSTPLAGIKGSLTLLRHDQLVHADGDELLAIALRQTERLQTQIREVIHDFAHDVKAVLPTVANNAPPASLRHVVDDALQAIQPAFTAAAIDLELDVQPECTDWSVRGDANQLARVVLNLLDNAARFAPADSKVTIRLTQADGEIQLGVIDQGPGVPPNLQTHLFDRFAQGDVGAGAAGLGLYFCRITVERSGGHIGYRDRPSGGACFWFTLPCARH